MIVRGKIESARAGNDELLDAMSIVQILNLSAVNTGKRARNEED